MEAELPEIADTCSTASPIKSVSQPDSEWCNENSQNSALKTFVF